MTTMVEMMGLNIALPTTIVARPSAFITPNEAMTDVGMATAAMSGCA